MGSTTPTADLPTTTTEEEYYEDYNYLRMTTGVQIPSAIGLSALIILAITGNAMTLVAYITDKKLHTVYDFFIFNLAITDLLLACISMPFYAVYTLMEFTWPFGMFFCKVYLVMDFTLCFESILLMLILSIDRLLLITYGPHYQIKITMKIAIIEVSVSWVLSFLVYGPAIIGWDYWVGYSTVEDMDCDVEFAYDFVFTTVTALVEFILPFICLTLLNTIIYCKIRKRNKIQPQRRYNQEPPSTSAHVPENNPKDPQFGNNIDNENPDKAGVSEREHLNRADGLSIINTNKVSKPSNMDKKASNKKINEVQTSRVQRESKAARFLAALVAVFLIFWAPYTITTMVISFCEEKCLNTSIYEFFNWVLWMKSAVNPFLYAFNSSRYRLNFKRYLTCRYRVVQTRSEHIVRTTHSNI